MARRNGFTLIETLMVIVVIGLAGLIALPKFADALAQNNLRGSRDKVMAFYSAARAVSVSSGRPAFLHLHGNKLYVTASPRRSTTGSGTQDTVGAVEDFATQYGITITSTYDSIRIDPNGVGSTAGDVVIKLLKGSRTDSILISQYGRVTK